MLDSINYFLNLKELNMKHLVLVVTIVMGLFFGGCASTTNGHVVSEKYQSKQTLSNWVEDQNGCKRWNPHPAPNETITWTGNCKNGKVDGFGTLEWYKNGKKILPSKSIGEFRNGKREGKVTCYETDGKFVGNFINDLHNGKGAFFYKNGNKYEGEYKNGSRHGVGTFFRKNRSKYVGEWRRNKKHGKGTMTFHNGGKYVGEWKSDNRHGKAIVTYPQNCKGEYCHKKFIGTYRSDTQSYGIMSFQNKEKIYTGYTPKTLSDKQLHYPSFQDIFKLNYSNYTIHEINQLNKIKKFGKNLSLTSFINSLEYKYFYSKVDFNIRIDKSEPYVYVTTVSPKKEIKVFAIENKNDISCIKSSNTYTRRLGAMEQLFTLGTSSKATVTEYRHTCKFQNGYKNRMKNLITQLNPSNLSSALKTLEGMEHWRSVSTSENWHVMDFIRKSASNASTRDTSYSSPSSSNKKIPVAKTNTIKNNKPCSYKVDNKRGNNTIIKCSDGHRADIKFRKNKWRRTTGMLSGYYDSFEEAANKECGCID
jgi:hypothetical protein